MVLEYGTWGRGIGRRFGRSLSLFVFVVFFWGVGG